ncbi:MULTISPECIES: hypothetical protein [Wolbachia]|uniref:hypothetical protein n=2 Tax=Wolbachia TaxID=953 RepID=UPI0001761E7A|nr:MULTISPECIES: hypothetical protein [Wolbachia]PBQ27220.1 hypothetical protein BTO27_03870 [Wolbachia pipientis wAus]QEK89305.1 hypothetical protein CAI20_00890 [Wolbachia endosymbiont of Chrysomya megacephala]CAQ54808.1 Hypothetical protein WP0700 [Wolbachia endosymbiont of Culex quinquefasciatus Pel]CQD08849.1 Uncharacterised protein [Wolbachia endosymbiont wPip_Mol of Culex molestus]
MLILILLKLKNIMEQQASNKEKGIEFRYNQCNQKCHSYKTKRTDQECLDKCYEKYVSKLYPQISEKLLASENNLYDESEKLLLIANEIHNQDAMFF